MSFPTFLPTVVVWAFVGFTFVSSTGCSMLKLPATMPFGSGSETEYVGRDGAPLRPSDSVLLYQKVREAKSQNCIVVQIPGAEPPIRTLPLPPGGRSVFVSDLLKQTGIIDEFSRLEVTLYRDSAQAIGGVRMAVKMSPDFDEVRPESDYALQAGDRLEVREAKATLLGGVFGGLLGM